MIAVAIALFLRVFATFGVFYGASIALGAAEFGFFSYALTVGALVSAVVEFGYSTRVLATKFDSLVGLFSIYSQARHVRPVLFAILAFPAIALCGVVGVDAGLGLSICISAAVCIVMSASVFSHVQTSETIVRVLAGSRLELRSSIAGNFIYLTIVLISLFLLGEYLIVAACALLVGRFVHLWFSGQVLRLAVSGHRDSFVWGAATIRRVTSSKGLIRLLGENFAFASHAIVGVSYLFVDSIIIGWLLGAEAVGRYQLLFRVVMGVGLLSDAAAAYLLQQLSRGASSAAVPFYLRDTGQLILGGGLSILTLLLSACVLLLQTDVVGEGSLLILGNSVDFGMLQLACIFALLPMIRFFAGLAGAKLTAFGLQGMRTVGGLAALVVSGAGTLLSVPSMGLPGAALANLAGNACLLCIYLVALRRGVK